ncbi:hypothetical protein [Desulfothermus sp.]
MKFRFGFFITILFIFFIIFLTNTYCNISSTKKIGLNKSLGLEFSGKLNFTLPIDINKFKFNGEISFLNIKFKGDFNVNIISKTPLNAFITSKSISADVYQLICLFKKIGVKLNLPKELSGTIYLRGVDVVIKGDEYNLHIKKIDGLNFDKQNISINELVFNGNLKKKLISLKVEKVNLSKTFIRQIDLNINNDILILKANEINLHLKSITRTIFKALPNIRKNLLSQFKKFEDIFPVNNINAKGVLSLKEVYTSLSGLVTKKIHLTKFFAKIDANPASVIIYNNKKNPVILSILTNSTNFIYSLNKTEVKSRGVLVNLHNLMLKKNIDIINTKSLTIPKLSVNLTGNASFEHKNNSTVVFFTSNVAPKGAIPIHTDAGSILKVISSPVNINIQNNKFKLSAQKILAQVRNGIVKQSNGNLNVTGDVQVKKIYIDFGIKDKKIDIKTNIGIYASNLQYNDLSALIKELKTYVCVSNKILELKNGTLNAKINQEGNVLLKFDTKIPLENIAYNLKSIYKDTFFDLTITDLEKDDINISSFKAKKEQVDVVHFDYSVIFPSGKIIGSTQAKLLSNRFDLITRKIKFYAYNQQKNKKQSKPPQKSDNNIEIKIQIPETIKEFSSHYHLEFDSLLYLTNEHEYEVSSLKGDILLKDHPSIGFNGYFCNISFSGGAEFLDKGVSGIVDIRAVGIPIDHLLGCFINKAPVYITGDTDIQVNINFQGDTIKKIEKNLFFDVYLDVNNGRILKLSNLGKKVSMILDILSFVKLNPSKLEDSLEFNKFALFFNGGLKTINIKQVTLKSSLLNLYASGKMDFNKNNMEIIGKIKRGFISKKFHFSDKIKKTNKESN